MFYAKAKRLKLKLTQWKVAQKAAIHPSDISRFERGKIQLGHGQRQRLAAALELPEFLLDQEVDFDESR